MEDVSNASALEESADSSTVLPAVVGVQQCTDKLHAIIAQLDAASSKLDTMIHNVDEANAISSTWLIMWHDKQQFEAALQPPAAGAQRQRRK